MGRGIHIGIDHQGTLHDKTNIDSFSTAYDMPAEDGEFDSAICITFLKHLEEPDQAIVECNRVLRPEGIAIYTTVLF